MATAVAPSGEPTEGHGGYAELAAPSARPRPLCVDLDGTLVTTDTVWESAFLLLRRRPWLMLWAPLWLLGGKRKLAAEISRRAPVEPATLPYRTDLLAALRQAKAGGRQLLLCSSGEPQTAQAVAAHLGCFDQVCVTSDGSTKSTETMLRDRFGETPFDFVGDGSSALLACRAATRGYLVGATSSLARRAERQANVTVLEGRPSLARAAVRALRPHQWAKNALVFLPLLLSPELPTLQLVLRALLATALFSLVASSGYVLNDLLDLEADRAHATKCNRPFASGALPIALGPPLFVALISASFTTSAWLLPPLFTAMLAAYFVATVSYSMWLKQRLLVDVLLLAGLYSHRVLSGGAATGIPISSWLLAFSMFFFLSLAFQKRYIELRASKSKDKLKSRGYSREDIEIVGPSGVATGFMAVLVFALYIESPDVADNYAAPDILWAACPVLIYWINRMWFLAHRGEVEDDPVKFALRDKRSVLCGAIMGLIAAAARFGPSWLG